MKKIKIISCLLGLLLFINNIYSQQVYTDSVSITTNKSYYQKHEPIEIKAVNNLYDNVSFFLCDQWPIMRPSKIEIYENNVLIDSIYLFGCSYYGPSCYCSYLYSTDSIIDTNLTFYTTGTFRVCYDFCRQSVGCNQSSDQFYTSCTDIFSVYDTITNIKAITDNKIAYISSTQTNGIYKLHFNEQNLFKNFKLTIYNIEGRKILFNNDLVVAEMNTIIDISMFPNGLYCLVVENMNDKLSFILLK